MNLDHLRYFEVLANMQHYGKAAEKLHVSQPNLTYAISQLEQELGLSLFEKKGRRIRLTRYGQEFLNTVRSSLDMLDSGTRAVMEAGQNGGFILIGSIRTLGTALVPNLMREFKEQMDLDIKFQLHSETGFSSSILKAAEEGRLDFCFTAAPGDPAAFETIAFECSPFVVIAPLDHPLAKRKKIRLEETISYPQICFVGHAGLRKSVDALFSAINATPISTMETEEDAIVAGLVAAGFGIAVIPDDPLLKSLPLKVIKLTNPNPVRVAYLSRLRGVSLPDAAESFWEFCKSRLQTQSS